MWANQDWVDGVDINKADLTRSDPKTSDLMRNERNGCVRDQRDQTSSQGSSTQQPEVNDESTSHSKNPRQVPGPADRTGFNHPGVFELDLILV